MYTGLSVVQEKTQTFGPLKDSSIALQCHLQFKEEYTTNS